MARWAQIHIVSGFVTNVFEWEGDTAELGPPEGYDLVEDTTAAAGPGMLWNGTEFNAAPGLEPVAPPPPPDAQPASP